ncbi:4'-phosphopantetheinyl transferase family protein [Paenibacillus tengchongensis]|uniref:4'-phosphopantetheinyl transferase family protein n=1 Tax=Paenibacillus tengchongensis TaxID=2608684 RepID=UPI00124C8E7E|nr:4'-phosphopantetheinyl transferase superfamily protein [Paenibacillus tengchongensis]
MKIYGVNLAEQLDNEFALEQWLGLLPLERRETISRFIRWSDRLRSFTGECLIRSLAGSYLGCRPSEVRIAKESNTGKPVLLYEGMHFNISHSGEWVVCAIDCSPIGIDVEEMKPIEFGIAERFFSVEEYQLLLSEPADRQVAVFYELWTLKESYLKQTGQGLSGGLDSFTVSRNGKGYYDENGRCFFRQYEVDPRYKLSVCAGHTEFPQEVIRLSLDHILQKIN